MAEQHFDAYTNSYDETLPPATPDEPTAYHATLVEQLIDEPITEEEIAATLAELKDAGFVRTEAAYPGCAEQWIPTTRPVRHVQVDKPVTGFTKGIEARLLAALDDLANMTADFDSASMALLHATMAEADARKELTECESTLIDGAHKRGDLGTNDKQRQAATKVLLATDPEATRLRAAHEAAQGKKERAGQALHATQEWMISLRIEVPALTALLNH